ncbi:MAG TPA: ammonia-forming cytochrome c nitrite reductase subunit c552, partial [Bacteroidales bacterium]|nr:ammonia-forming cytochrome c nitrite reductase subunit c552 [Bacteroidales bacterium]
GYNEEVPMPDISTKEKAEQYVGLDSQKLKTEKEEWKVKVLPQWLSKAEERESKMPEPKRIK